METVTLSLDVLEPPLLAMERRFEGEAFEDLVRDIRDKGLLQPLVVNPIRKEALEWDTDDPRWKEAEIGRWRDRYRIQAGWRRYNACRAAGLTEVACVIAPTDDKGEIQNMLRENLHREDPNPAAEGAVFAVLEEHFKMNHPQIAEEVHRSVSYVRSRLALVRGPLELREAVRAGDISLSVALELARCEHPADRERLLYHAIRGGFNVTYARLAVVEAATMRSSLPPTADPAAPVVSEEAPPPPMGTCDWCERRVPFNTLVFPKVCASCLAEYQEVQRQVRVLEQKPPEGGRPDA